MGNSLVLSQNVKQNYLMAQKKLKSKAQNRYLYINIHNSITRNRQNVYVRQKV